MTDHPPQYRVPQVGLKGYRIHITRQPDDTEHNVLRASIGGRADIGFYLQFRGDPEQVADMLEIVQQAAADMLPRGNYKDDRRTNMTHHKATIYQDDKGEWRWRVQAANNEIISEGEGYDERAAAVVGLYGAHHEFAGMDLTGTDTATVELA